MAMGFTGAACFSVCAVIFAICGPLSPFSGKGGYAPWFESEESYFMTNVVDILHLTGRCTRETTKVKMQWSMFGVDFVSETSCNGTPAEQESFDKHFAELNRKVVKSNDYEGMCDNASTDGLDAFCDKRYNTLVFWWLTVGFGLTAYFTAVGAIARSSKPVGILCVLVSFLTALFAVIGFAIGASGKADLEDHFTASHENKEWAKLRHSASYEVKAEAGLALAAVAMVLAILLVPMAIFGLVQLMKKPVAKPEEKVEEPGPVLLESKEEPKEEPKEEAPVEEPPVEVAAVVVEVQEEEPVVDDRLARLATLEMEQEDAKEAALEEAAMSAEAMAAAAEVLKEDKEAAAAITEYNDNVEGGLGCNACVAKREEPYM